MFLYITSVSLCLFSKITEVMPNSFFLLEQGDSNCEHFIERKGHFACDRDQSCTHVKYDKATKQFTLIKEGDPVKNTASGNEIVRRKVLQTFDSCKTALQQHINEKIFWIQHKNMIRPVKVRCKREGGTIFAVFDHDSESRTRVKGFEGPGSYVRTFKYDSSIRDIAAFVDSSLSCKQFTRIDCFDMGLTFPTAAQPKFGFLVDRNGASMQYIGGGPANGEGCSCGITNTCAVSGKRCNCDANDGVWRFDEGYVIEKARLPLTQVRLGDTGGKNEEGAHTIGELICEE